MDIVKLHKTKKEYLEYVKNKFELNFNNKQKFLKKVKKAEDIYHFKGKQSKVEEK